MPLGNRIRFHLKNVQTKARIPNYQDLVWIQCDIYRCLAYHGDNSKWINFYTGKKLTNFIKVIG